MFVLVFCFQLSSPDPSFTAPTIMFMVQKKQFWANESVVRSLRQGPRDCGEGSCLLGEARANFQSANRSKLGKSVPHIGLFNLMYNN